MSNYGNGRYQQDGYQQQSDYHKQSGFQGDDLNTGYQQPSSQQHGQRGEASQYYSPGSHPQKYGQQNPDGLGGYGQEPQYQQYLPVAHSSNSGGNSTNQGHQNQYEGEGTSEGDRGIMGGLAGGAAGAFGGHAVGGKAGHGKTGTLVGALAGAFAGHKAQDAASDWKDERDEKKKWEKQQAEQQNYDPLPSHTNSHQQSDQPTRGDFGGNFTASSRDMRLDAHGDYTLHAACRRPDNSYQSSSISLNRILANDAGSFRWSGATSNGSSTYTVQEGDTLRTIAGRFAHCTFDELATHNNISNPDLIYPGQHLKIPGEGFGGSARNMRLVDGGQRLEGELEDGGKWVLRSVNLDERIANRNGCLEFV